jgi:hypothetical protein
MLDRLELVLAQLVELERQRDAVIEDEAPGRAEASLMMRSCWRRTCPTPGLQTAIAG